MRVPELASLQEAFREVVAGAAETRLAVVTGPAGMGKTWLCDQLAAECEEAGALVLAGACPRPCGAPAAYAPFATAWRGSPEPFASLLAGLSRLQGEPPELTQAWLASRILDQLGRWSRPRPVVLIVEDVHLIDPASLALVQAVATARGTGRLLLVLSTRSHEPSAAGPVVTELASRPHARRIELGPMPDAEIRELVAGRCAPDAVDSVARRAAGHPLFALELARHRGPGLPESLSLLLGQRVRELGRDGIRLLAAVSQGGADGNLAEVLGIAADRLADLVAAATERGLLAAGGPLRCRHPLFGEAAEAELNPAERTDLHRRLASGLDAGGRHVRAAWHWERAGEPETALLRWHAGGLAAAGRHSHAEAAHAFQRALALRDTLPERSGQPSRVELALAAATALRWSAQPTEAAAVLRRALAVAPAGDLAGRCELLCRLWDCRFIAGNRQAAYETLAEATALAKGLPGSPLTARLAAAEGSCLMTLGRYAEGAEQCRRAERHAEQTGDPATRAYALSTWGVCLAFIGATDDAIAILGRAREVAHRIGSVRELVRAASNLTYVLANTGQHERAAQIGAEELARLDCLGLSGALGGPLHYNLATSLLALGRWSELNERALAAESQVPAGKAARLQLCRAEVAALRGERDRAGELLRSASATIDGPDRLFEAERAIPDAVAARQSGRPRAAVESCRAALSQVPEGLGPIELLRLCAEGLGALADLTSARGRFTRLADPEVALAEFRAAARSREPRTPEERALSLLCEAEALRLSGPDDAAPALWQEVVAAWDRLRIVYHAGYARMRLAEALVAKRDQGAAGEPLRRAFQIAGKLAAVPLRDETARVAKRGRIPLPSPAPELDGPDLEVLTRREREVLELVSWGRTNREIADALVLSVRTVGVHVSRILTKLGASNRAEAARLAHGGLPTTATKHT